MEAAPDRTNMTAQSSGCDCAVRRQSVVGVTPMSRSRRRGAPELREADGGGTLASAGRRAGPAPGASGPAVTDEGSKGMPRPIAEQVVVLVGASSGIGRASALAFARDGARVVCAARSVDALDGLVEEITAAGGTAISVPTDVADEDAVHRLA